MIKESLTCHKLRLHISAPVPPPIFPSTSVHHSMEVADYGGHATRWWELSAAFTVSRSCYRRVLLHIHHKSRSRSRNIGQSSHRSCNCRGPC